MHLTTRRDALALIAVAGAGLFAWNSFGRRGAGQRIVYVSPDGSDWSTGASLDAPVRTIGRALASVPAGGEVRILPGVYRERVHVRRGGRPGRPLAVAAVEPGTVTITWDAPGGLPVSSGWQAEGDGIWSAWVDQPVYCLRDGEEHLFRVLASVAQLRRYVRRPGAWSAFFYQNERLYVYLREGRRPEGAVFATHGPVPEPREWGEFKSANMWIEADHVDVRGLRFDFGIGAGVRIWNAEHVTVSGCSFTGCAVGVRAARGIKPSRHVRVERCVYHNYPQHHWQRGWLSWNEIYAVSSGNGLIASIDPDTEVLDCIAAHCGDALMVTTFRQEAEAPVTIAHNWIAFTTDDAMELDGAGSHLHIRDNLVLRAHVAVAASPVTEGPALVERNLCIDCQCHLKLVSPRQPDGSVPATRNVTLRNNIFTGGYPTYWSDRDRFVDCAVTANVFAGTNQDWQGWPDGVSEADNLWIPRSSGDPATGGVSSAEGLASMFAGGDGRAPFDAFGQARLILRRRPGPSWWPISHPATGELNAFASALAERLG